MAHLNGIDTYFERTGDGRPLLFLNGSGATLASASLLVQPFTESADTVAADQRGLGRTEVPPGPYTMAEYAADALALADHVGWATFALVGVSFGGMVAQEVAVTAPERIDDSRCCAPRRAARTLPPTPSTPWRTCRRRSAWPRA